MIQHPLIAFEQERAAKFEQSLSIPTTIETPIVVASETEFETTIYKVFYGERNLGIFRKTKDGYLTEPFYSNVGCQKTICDSEQAAQDAIVASYNKTMNQLTTLRQEMNRICDR